MILRGTRRGLRSLHDPLIVRVLGLDSVERMRGERRRDGVVERLRPSVAERVRRELLECVHARRSAGRLFNRSVACDRMARRKSVLPELRPVATGHAEIYRTAPLTPGSSA
ncbi:hypothetical protein BN903_69 [Halorubrum sp. AJ67]|nr:hypothetical protein BN903_69 [Halorubrum sp. AJ67]